MCSVVPEIHSLSFRTVFSSNKGTLTRWLFVNSKICTTQTSAVNLAVKCNGVHYNFIARKPSLFYISVMFLPLQNLIMYSALTARSRCPRLHVITTLPSITMTFLTITIICRWSAITYLFFLSGLFHLAQCLRYSLKTPNDPSFFLFI